MSTYRLAFHYYIIRKSDGLCHQYINSNVPDWSIDNEEDYSIELDGEYNVLGNYYINNVWYKKVWNSMVTEYYYDENGNQIEGSEHEVPDVSAGYTMVEFTPEFV